MKSSTLFAALACLWMVDAHAYRIVEARYGVETASGPRDQLIVRCDDGRLLTVGWEAALREACSEGGAAAPAVVGTPTAPAVTRQVTPIAAVFPLLSAPSQPVRLDPPTLLEQAHAPLRRLPEPSPNDSPLRRLARRDSAVSSINVAHQWCVRGNPRVTCDTVRANALKAVADATAPVAER